MTVPKGAKQMIERLKKAGRAFAQAYNEKGQEIPDSTRIEVPLKFKRPPDIHELIASAVRTERFRQSAEAAGVESWEEANDFEVDGEREDVPTSYELTEMQEEFYNSDRRNVAVQRRQNGRSKAEKGTGHARSVGEADSANGESKSGAVGAGAEEKGRVAASGGASDGGEA